MAPEAMEKLCQTGHKKEIAKKLVVCWLTSKYCSRKISINSFNIKTKGCKVKARQTVHKDDRQLHNSFSLQLKQCSSNSPKKNHLAIRR
jgi:hypothetical protein